MLQDDKALAIKFAEICERVNYDVNGQIENIDLFSDVHRFVIQAIKTLGSSKQENSDGTTTIIIPKVNDASNLRYLARGATPSEYDIEMASNLAQVAADVIAEGNPGAYVVAYEEGMDPFTQQPGIFRPVKITNDNNLSDAERYPDEFLRENGVFWIDDWEDNTP